MMEKENRPDVTVGGEILKLEMAGLIVIVEILYLNQPGWRVETRVSICKPLVNLRASKAKQTQEVAWEVIDVIWLFQILTTFKWSGVVAPLLPVGWFMNCK